MKGWVVAMAAVASGSLLQACATPTQPAATTAPSGTKAPAGTQAAAQATAAPAAGTAKKGGELIYATSEPTASIEPHLEALDARTQRTVLIYENLTWVDFDMVPQPQLAESWETPDEKTYIFKLRKGVKFHNGKEMDAEDVKYSYERVLDPNTGSGGRGDLILIDKIEAVDKYTVRIKLKAPFGAFLAALGGRYNAVIPKDFIKTGNELRTAACGTGPFRVESFDANDKLVLSKFQDHRDKDQINLDRLIIQTMPDESSIVAALRSGTVGIAKIRDAKNYALIKDDKRMAVGMNPALRWVVLDLTGDPAPLDKLEFRQAVQLSLDRPGLFQTVGRGLGARLGMLPQALKPYALKVEDLPLQNRDLAKAKELLAKAGYASGASFKVRTIAGSSLHSDSAQFLEANLREAGIQIQIEAVDAGVWGKDWVAGTTPAVMNDWGGFTDPDLAFFRHFHSKPDGMDFRRFKNGDADKLLDQGRTTLDPAKRKPIYDQLQKLLAEQSITIPLFEQPLIYATNTWVKGFRSHATGFLFGLRNTWIDK
ncbi:MAG: ABC transporter substrate-binding protein [Chloroflexota bacterium]